MCRRTWDSAKLGESFVKQSIFANSPSDVESGNPCCVTLAWQFFSLGVCASHLHTQGWETGIP